MPRARVNDISISYTERGQGEALVLIMGLGASKDSWFMNMPTLGKYYRVIAFNSRGVGRTARLDEPYSVYRMAEDTVGLLDFLGIDRAHFVGVSLGSMIAQEIAISFPQRVGRLVLAAATAGMNESVNYEFWESKSAELRESTGLGEDFNERIRSDAENVDVKGMMTRFTALAFGRRVFRIPMVLGARWYFKQGGFSGVIDQLRAVSTYNTIDRLDRIQSPTLVMAGTHDKIVPIEFSRVVAERIPGARMLEFEGGSHSFFMEMSRRFNKEVVDFLRC
ncbi:MAG: alpha/beta fold hydrolase [Chloroflexota bacterium]|nr:alpha/beta fold hydrolase [Chloroflexota bacterium]